jgi:hypothetical protein
VLLALMMEAACTSETLVNLCQTTWCCNPEESDRHMFIYFQIYSPHIKLNSFFGYSFTCEVILITARLI